jgi:hypothetical protein
MIPPPGRLPPWNRYKPVGAWLNQLYDYVISLAPSHSQNTLTTHTALGVMRRGRPSAEDQPSMAVQRFKIRALKQIYLECYEITISVLGEDVVGTEVFSVAKPFYLRDGVGGNCQTGTMSYTNPNTRILAVGGGTATESICPAYLIGDEIWAMETSGTGIHDEAADPILWLDLNVDGRRWQMLLREYAVCENNVVKHVKLLGSTTY